LTKRIITYANNKRPSDAATPSNSFNSPLKLSVFISDNPLLLPYLRLPKLLPSPEPGKAQLSTPALFPLPLPPL